MIHRYSYNPIPLFAGEGPRFFGVELEVEAKDESQRDTAAAALVQLLDLDEKRFYLKRDGSLTCGFEIVTHPHSLGAHEDVFPWGQILAFLQSTGFSSENNTCGLHIHVSRDSASAETWMKVGYFVNNQQARFERLARRSSRHHCEYKDKVLADGDVSEDRYEAVNFTNKATVEFRLFRGTLDSEVLLGSVALVDAVIDFCEQVSSETLLQKSVAWDLFRRFLCNYPRAELLAETLPEVTAEAPFAIDDSHGADEAQRRAEEMSSRDDDIPF